MNLSDTPMRLVVLVDDDSQLRKSIESLLASTSIPVQGFEHAVEALQFLGRESVGCVITDLEMSGMSGWELQCMIAKTYPDLPVIIVTGRNGHNLEQAGAQGVFAFIFKPFEEEELIDTVHRALGRGVSSLATSP